MFFITKFKAFQLTKDIMEEAWKIATPKACGDFKDTVIYGIPMEISDTWGSWRVSLREHSGHDMTARENDWIIDLPLFGNESINYMICEPEIFEKYVTTPEKFINYLRKQANQH